jgi:hypothetical protein
LNAISEEAKFRAKLSPIQWMLEMIFDVLIRKGKKDGLEFTGGDCLKNGRDMRH